MTRIQTFFQFLRDALSEVHNDYYGLHWWNGSMLNYHIGSEETPERQTLKEYLNRYGERVFCYELYHQLRKRMDIHSTTNPETFENVLLQSELKKELIGEIVERYHHVQALDSEYFPDFLLHTPGNFDNQDIIIEVKSNPDLSFSGMKDDLLKIQQFISRYRYQQGIFLTVNTNPQRISRSLQEPQNVEWLRKNISTTEQISILCKKKNDVELFEKTIKEILEIGSS